MSEMHSVKGRLHRTPHLILVWCVVDLAPSKVSELCLSADESRDVFGSANTGPDVRRRGNAALAGFARKPAEAVRAAGRGPLNVPADAATRRRPDVRVSARDHQYYCPRHF